jgi:hypothetical protein
MRFFSESPPTGGSEMRRTADLYDLLFASTDYLFHASLEASAYSVLRVATRGHPTRGSIAFKPSRPDGVDAPRRRLKRASSRQHRGRR